jgi:hypothetical protein
MNEMKVSVIKMLYKRIQEYINKNAKEDQVTIKAKTTIGYPSDKIIEYANKETIDIIMGTSDWDLQKSRH